MYEITNFNNIKQTMSSREIAELTSKEHRHVLRDCDVLNENYDKIGLPKIGQGYYTLPVFERAKVTTKKQVKKHFLLGFF